MALAHRLAVVVASGRAEQGRVRAGKHLGARGRAANDRPDDVRAVAALLILPVDVAHILHNLALRQVGHDVALRRRCALRRTRHIAPQLVAEEARLCKFSDHRTIASQWSGGMM